MEQPLVVQAEYSFKCSNNDELCFKKGDLITVTQREEGGWWEGTLNDKTGWFPSNYVHEYKAPLPLTETIRPHEEIQEFRSVVLKDLLDSEQAHVAEIQGLLENFLEPLQQTQILNSDEYAQLMCNFVEIVKIHNDLLQQIKDCNDRVGKLFLTKAPLLKQVHQAYCAAHPRAIVILDKHKDALEKYMERQGAATPGLLVLTTGLSKPFRRLDKYSAMLQELERHMESNHPDRGDTQRSVAVYKDIAATCSATRRQKELELQVLTGPIRCWQGPELSSYGDIIHMGSVAVGSDHRDRYFVLFPQTLLILSVSQRMSAFIYEGKLPINGIIVNRLEDTETYKNAFEISGPLTEGLIAVCQGPNEANRWVDLLRTTNTNATPIGIKRQLSNLSNTSINSGLAMPQSPVHMSPPTNLNTLNQRNSNQQQPQQQQQQQQQSAQTAAGQLQHKRSLSFNHHLSFNQYMHNQPYQQQQHQLQQQHHHANQQEPLSLPNQPAVPSHKSNLVPTSNNILKTPTPPIANRTTITSAIKIGNTKANWSITNLRPAPSLRPNLLLSNTSNSSSGSGSAGGGGGGGGSSNTLSSYCYNHKNQPTFEEDALVLRVFEAYCAAYQNNARNTIHSALQPWTPCLPIRGGKLKTSKHFSTSNPQLPFICNTITNTSNNTIIGNANKQQRRSSNSLNSSFIWREANPNNFNMYSTSVSTLNTNANINRYSVNSSTTTIGIKPNGSPDLRSLSEERATRKSLNRLKSGFGSGYDNIFMTPLLPRKNKLTATTTTTTTAAANASQSKVIQNIYQSQQQQRSSPTPTRQTSKLLNQRKNSTDNNHQQQQSIINPSTQHPGLYDRRLNRSFEATTTTTRRYDGFGGGYLLNCGEQNKTNKLRRSTPHLAADNKNLMDANGDDSGENENSDHGCGMSLLRNNSSANCKNGGNTFGENQRHSGTWCCSNFVMKQWRKINNY